jgi:hypothetical protein
MIGIAITNIRIALEQKLNCGIVVFVTEYDTLTIKIVFNDTQFISRYDNITYQLQMGLTTECIVNTCLAKFKSHLISLYFKKA